MAPSFKTCLRRPDDPNLSRLDTLADYLQSLGINRGVVILLMYILVVPGVIIGGGWLLITYIETTGVIGSFFGIIAAYFYGCYATARSLRK